MATSKMVAAHGSYNLRLIPASALFFVSSKIYETTVANFGLKQKEFELNINIIIPNHQVSLSNDTPCRGSSICMVAFPSFAFTH